jgi:hypothetical protein
VNRKLIPAACLAGLLVAVLPAAPALADPPPPIPQSATDSEIVFSPAYDYDGDGCYSTAAIGPDGTLNPGLNPTGAVNGHCHDPWDLDDTGTYSRAKCTHGWCAIVYASYFEKDQALAGVPLGGHRHDWEHVISWISQDSGQIEFVSTTQHSGQKTYPRSEVLFEGTHPKVVYHKDGASTHFFRLAGSHDDPPENAYHTWQHPPIIGYDSWPDQDLRDELMAADFGSATIKINDGRFESLLNAAKPAGIPFDPYG